MTPDGTRDVTGHGTRDGTSEAVTTAHWRLFVPAGEGTGATVCIPTIHPVGDQRIIRCAQAALDAGWNLHFVWLGGTPGVSRPHLRITERRLPAAASFASRLARMADIVRAADGADADLWHVHDLLMLPLARRWSDRTGRPLLYDVHEYYPEYFAGKVPPRATRLRSLVRRGVAAAEASAVRGCRGVNAVSGALADRLRVAAGSPIATPNLPLTAPFRSALTPLTPARLRRVAHIGSLSPGYGSEVIARIAAGLLRAAPEVELLVVQRFHSESARRHFTGALRRVGTPANVRLVDPMPTHRLAGFLGSCGIGLSALQDRGQAALAVPTKLYEYVLAGMAVVASDLPATRNFVSERAVGTLVPVDDPDAYVDAIARYSAAGPALRAQVDAAARAGLTDLSWENVCAPRLRRLFHDLAARPDGGFDGGFDGASDGDAVPGTARADLRTPG